DATVTGVQTCALPISEGPELNRAGQKHEASGQQAQPHKPSEGSVRGTSHRPFISGMGISVEPGRIANPRGKFHLRRDAVRASGPDRKSTRLNSSHGSI